MAGRGSAQCSAGVLDRTLSGRIAECHALLQLANKKLEAARNQDKRIGAGASFENPMLWQAATGPKPGSCNADQTDHLRVPTLALKLPTTVRWFSSHRSA